MQLIQGQGLDAVLYELQAMRNGKITPLPEKPPEAATAEQGPAAVEIALSLATGRFAAGEGEGKDRLAETMTLPATASSAKPPGRGGVAIGVGTDESLGRHRPRRPWRRRTAGSQGGGPDRHPGGGGVGPRRTDRASCTGTSSRRTCCSIATATSGLRISGWPKRLARTT